MRTDRARTTRSTTTTTTTTTIAATTTTPQIDDIGGCATGVRGNTYRHPLLAVPTAWAAYRSKRACSRPYTPADPTPLRLSDSAGHEVTAGSTVALEEVRCVRQVPDHRRFPGGLHEAARRLHLGPHRPGGERLAPQPRRCGRDRSARASGVPKPVSTPATSVRISRASAPRSRASRRRPGPCR